MYISSDIIISAMEIYILSAMKIYKCHGDIIILMLR